MPTIPVITAQVDTTAAPQLNVRRDIPDGAFGLGAIGRAAQGVASLAQEQVAQEIERQNSVAVMEADRQLSDWESANLYDANTGALSQKGKNAFGLPDKLMPSYDQAAQKIEQGLANDRQRLAFRKMSQSRRDGVDRILQRHLRSEFDQYDDAETNSYLRNSREAAALNYNDPSRIGTELARQRGAILSKAQRDGWSAEATQSALRTAESTTHENVLDRMMADGMYREAKVYFAQVSDGLDAQTRSRLDKAVQESGLRADSQAQADNIMGRAGSRTEAMRLARAIQDPELRDATEQRVRGYWNERESEREQAERDLSEGAWNLVLDGRAKGRDQIPPAMWAALPPSQKKSMLDYWDELAKPNGGKEIKTDPATYYEIEQLAADDPTKFRSVNLLQYADRLSNTDLKRFMRIQNSGKDDNGATVFELQTKTQVVNDLLTGAKIDPKKPAAAEFKQRLDAELKAHQAATGKKPTNEDITALGKKLLVRGYVEGSGYFGSNVGRDKRFAFQARPGEKLAIEDITFDTIPLKDRDAITAALRKRKIEPTEDRIVDMYTRAVSAEVNQ